MLIIHKKIGILELLRRFSFTLLLMTLTTLVACGGGDGGLTGGNDGGGTDPKTTLSISISNSNVTEQNPATISVTALIDGQVIAGEVVTFTTSLGSFLPETGTALTGNDGIATIVLNGGSVSGAGIVTAEISSGESASVGFTTQAPSAIILRLGSGTPFVEGNINISLSSLSAGGTSVISASLVDEQDQLYSESAEFTFTSLCSTQVAPTASLDSPVVTSNGKAESIYFAKGCVGSDPITVNVIVNGQNLSATGFIEVLSADVGSIQFVSATPDHIAIQSVGSEQRPESATVIFRVLDTNGVIVSNQNVSFSLNSSTGGVQLNPSTATTNNEGLVQTVVNSGTAAGTVRVIASVDESDPLLITQSSLLKISTGIPDQDSMSISASLLNPEGWDLDGTEVIITARLADASNNPPPPTIVYFTTEGGSIETLGSSCITDPTGACTVAWRSQSPKPQGKKLFVEGESPRTTNIDLDGKSNFMGQKYGGRVTILATTIGEESFPDLNNNGRFDECEMPAFTGGTGKPCNAEGGFDTSKADIIYDGKDVGGRLYDLQEAYSDYNEDGFFNPSEENAAEQLGGELEEPVDFNQDGLFNDKDGKYNGVLCSIPTHIGCSDIKSIDVRDSLVLVMSGSAPEFVTSNPISKQITISGESTASATVIIADLHNQPMPAGSTVEFSMAGDGSIVSDSQFIWPNHNHNGGSSFSATIKGVKDEGEGEKTGALFVKVTTPSGVATSYQVAEVTLNPD